MLTGTGVAGSFAKPVELSAKQTIFNANNAFLTGVDVVVNEGIRLPEDQLDDK